MDNTITPAQMATALDKAAPGIEILSLDCFDTVIWRNTHAPKDVFADLPEAGSSINQRMWAEQLARLRARRKKRDEVSIAEIYGSMLPDGEKARHDALIAAEIDAEARHCFAFRPAVELIQDAKRRGLKVIIVSDTYLDHVQLAELIRRVAGEETLKLIDRIFCSSEYGVPKSGGLFRHVLQQLNASPRKILHMGDNAGADFEAPRKLGINAAHLAQFTFPTLQRLRLEASMSAILHTGGLHEAPRFQPHRAQLALAEDQDPGTALGYATLGPIMHGFSRWLQDEAAKLQAQTSGRVHMLFLMRDGYLPKLCFDAIAGADAPATHAVEVSRFTGFAASFTDQAKILRYAESQTELTADVIAQQLLFTKEERVRMLGPTAHGKDTSRLREELRPKALGKVMERSKAFAGRFIEYIRTQVQPERGDTLMLVDLGYNGTVQNCIDPVLRRELGVEVEGRYLLLCESEFSTCSKRGFLDKTNYDFNALHALCIYVAVLEQLCTAAQGSVIDYADGQSVRSKSGIKGRQSDVRDRVQAGCIEFVRAYGAGFLTPPASEGVAARRQAAASALARLLFLPSAEELQVLDDFEHDVNFGSKETLKLFDSDVAGDGLKQFGLFYIKNARRMYLPAELRGQGLPLSLTLMMHGRYGLNLKYEDFCDKKISLPLLVSNGQDVSLDEVDAMSTHEGYFMAAIPIGDRQFTIGVRFGMPWEWVQIQTVHFVPAHEFMAAGDYKPIEAAPVYEGMEQAAGGLVRCTSENAFMMVPPPGGKRDGHLMLIVVFRPIAERATAAGQVLPAGELAA